MPEFKRFARAFKERAVPAAKKGAVLFGRATEKGARVSFQLLREKGAPKAKEISAKMWALMRERGAPVMKQVLTKKITPKIAQAGAFTREKAFPRIAKSAKEKMIPAMRAAGRGIVAAGKWAAPRIKNVSLNTYEKMREQRIRRNYGGSSVSARASRVSMEATGKAILGLRITDMLVKQEYSPEIAVQMIETLHSAAKTHPAAENRRVGMEMSKHALTLFHEGLRAGMTPEEAYGVAARALLDAHNAGIKLKSAQDVQEFMKSYYKIVQHMRALEPPVLAMKRAKRW